MTQRVTTMTTLETWRATGGARRAARRGARRAMRARGAAGDGDVPSSDVRVRGEARRGEAWRWEDDDAHGWAGDVALFLSVCETDARGRAM